MIQAADLTQADIGTTVALTQFDTIRGRLDALEHAPGRVYLTVDGVPLTIWPDTLVHLSPEDKDTSTARHDAVVHDLLTALATRKRTQA